MYKWLQKKIEKRKESKTVNFTKNSKHYSKQYSKRAVLIGLNYPESHYTLKGCINDVRDGSKYLKSLDYSVKVLTDQEINKSYNVLHALTELGRSHSHKLFFHYSGHGTRLKDQNGDEQDGYDEALYLGDKGCIRDDEINKVVRTFSEDQSVFMIWDCCHSGTIVDLPYVYTQTSGVCKEKVATSVSADVVAISGCRDSETSGDVTEDLKSYGALSNTLYKLLSQNKTRTWRQLYHELLVEMQRAGYRQYPVLSASRPELFYQLVEL